MLKDNGILLTSEIDTNDETYQKWKNQKISPKEYLNYCISQQWIDISQLSVDEKYADSSEVYDALCNYILDHLKDDKDFDTIIYEYMIARGDISPRKLCIILFEQGVLDYDDATVNKLKNGTLAPYDFIMDKINRVEITPAQLAIIESMMPGNLKDLLAGFILTSFSAMRIFSAIAFFSKFSSV